MIPALAVAYQALRNSIFGRLETGWDKIIYGEVEVENPPPERRGLAGMLGALVENLGGGPRNEPALHEADEMEEENVIEVRVIPDDDEMPEDVPLVLEMEFGEEQPQGDEALPAVPEAAPQDAGEQDEGQQLQQEGDNGQQRNRHVAPRAARFSITRLLVKASVALAFPSISFTCGELLRLVLPTAVTGGRGPMGYSSSARGLLHTTWGRSFVGGAMFLVVKDMLQLYAKYRMAAIKPLRRIPSVPRRRNA